MKIISSAPSKISLFGGSTDLPTYSDRFSGFVVNLAISLKSHVTLTFPKNEPNNYPADADPKLFDFILTSTHVYDKVSISSSFDGQIGCGLGSSASAAVALLGAITEYKKLHKIKPKIIAEKAWDLENNKLHLSSGKQDQFASAFGGGNGWIFGTNKTIKQIPLAKLEIDFLYPFLLLVYVGGTRDSHKIQQGFTELSEDQIDYLNDLKSIAREGYKAILQKEIHKIAELMRASWALKKKTNKGITNKRIDLLYDIARKNGALSGKINGAGGGGYMLFLTENKEKVMNSLRKFDCEEIPFKIDYEGLEVKKYV